MAQISRDTQSISTKQRAVKAYRWHQWHHILKRCTHHTKKWVTFYSSTQTSNWDKRLNWTNLVHTENVKWLDETATCYVCSNARASRGRCYYRLRRTWNLEGFCHRKRFYRESGTHCCRIWGWGCCGCGRPAQRRHSTAPPAWPGQWRRRCTARAPRPWACSPVNKTTRSQSCD